MRNRRVRLPLALGLVVLLPAALAVADEHEPCTDEEGELVFDEVTQWVKAPDTKLGNLGATDLGDYPTWSDEEPTASVFDGAGGGSLQHRFGNVTGMTYEREVAGHFEGTFTGCIDLIAWDLYLLSPLPPVQGTVTTIAQLVIDGNPIYVNPGDPAPGFNAPGEGDTGMLYRMQFAFTGVYDVMSRFPAGFEPLEEEHTIELTLYSQFINDAQGFYVYDTTEAPSHLTFNKAEGLGNYTLLETS
jgi:hypothetical protein